MLLIDRLHYRTLERVEPNFANRLALRLAVIAAAVVVLSVAAVASVAASLTNLGLDALVE